MALGMLMLSACGIATEENSEQPAIASITTTPSQVFLSAIGNTLTIQPEARDASNKPLLFQPSFTWSSDDELVASVDSSGLVTASGLGQTSITVSSGDISTIVPITVDTNSYTLSGRVTYQDKLYANGLITASAGPYKSVRFALVDMVDNTSGETITTTATDASGYYSFSAFTTGDYYLRVLAKTDNLSGYDVSIKDLQNNLYAVTSTINLATTTIIQDIAIATTSPVAGAFNMLDVFTAASEYIEAISSGTQAMDPLNVFWSNTNKTYGTYACSGTDTTWCIRGPGIYVLGGDPTYEDTDEYDDDVLWHEYAHFLEHNLNHFDSPGGYHLLTDNTLDLRLAWSEGFGDYLSGAIKTWLRVNKPIILSIDPADATTIYNDTAGTTTYINFDFGNPAGESCTTCIYASNEAAVAKALFGLTSNGNDTFDLWYSLSSHLPFTSDWINMESFWDGWLASTVSANILTDQAILAERQIYYQEDAKEPDNSILEVSAAPINCTLAGECYNQEHYLYRDAALDGDFISIEVSAGMTYTINTQNLKNGADTLINLRNGSGSLRASNDDRFPPNCCVNNSSNLSSSISYLAPATETLYVEVITSTDLANWAGRYGTYTLTVSASL